MELAWLSAAPGKVGRPCLAESSTSKARFQFSVLLEVHDRLALTDNCRGQGAKGSEKR